MTTTVRPTPNVVIKFSQPEYFKKSYLRNNRSNAKKSVRCFPFCKSPHSVNSFCGRDVLIEAFLECSGERETSDYIKGAIFLAAFQLVDPVDDHIWPEHFTLSSLSSRIKSKENPHRDFFIGDIVRYDQKTSVCFVNLNRHCKTFHYSWKGERFMSPRTEHCMVARAYLPLDMGGEDPTYFCRGECYSPYFTISCVRRSKALTPCRTESFDDEQAADESATVLAKRKLLAKPDISAPSHQSPDIIHCQQIQSVCPSIGTKRNKEPDLSERNAEMDTRRNLALANAERSAFARLVACHGRLSNAGKIGMANNECPYIFSSPCEFASNQGAVPGQLIAWNRLGASSGESTNILRSDPLSTKVNGLTSMHMEPAAELNSSDLNFFSSCPPLDLDSLDVFSSDSAFGTVILHLLDMPDSSSLNVGSKLGDASESLIHVEESDQSKF